MKIIWLFTLKKTEMLYPQSNGLNTEKEGGETKEMKEKEGEREGKGGQIKAS